MHLKFCIKQRLFLALHRNKCVLLQFCLIFPKRCQSLFFCLSDFIIFETAIYFPTAAKLKKVKIAIATKSDKPFLLNQLKNLPRVCDIEHTQLCRREIVHRARISKRLRSPGIDSASSLAGRSDNIICHTAKLLRSPGIDSKESISSAYEAWRAGTTTLFLLGPQPPQIVLKLQHRLHRLLKRLQIRSLGSRLTYTISGMSFTNNRSFQV